MAGGIIFFINKKLNAPINMPANKADPQHTPATTLAIPTRITNKDAAIPDCLFIKIKVSAMGIKKAICSDIRPLVRECGIIGVTLKTSNGRGK